jgi:hypothetical protein
VEQLAVIAGLAQRQHQLSGCAATVGCPGVDAALRERERDGKPRGCDNRSRPGTSARTSCAREIIESIM